MLLQKFGLLPIPKIITVLGKHMFCNHISKTLSLCLQQAVLLSLTPQGCKLCQMPYISHLFWFGILWHQLFQKKQVPELAHIFF